MKQKLSASNLASHHEIQQRIFCLGEINSEQFKAYTLYITDFFTV